MGKRQSKTILLFAVALLLSVGLIIAFVGTQYGWQLPWETQPNEVGMSLLIEYADGTTKEVTPDAIVGSNVLRLDVTWEGKKIVGISGWLHFKLTYDGTLKSTVGKVALHRYFDGTKYDTITYDSLTNTLGPIPDYIGIPKSGEWTKYTGCNSFFTQKMIEYLDKGAYKSRTLKFGGTLSLNINWTDGRSQTLEGSAETTATITVKQGTTLELQITNVALTIMKAPLK